MFISKTPAVPPNEIRVLYTRNMRHGVFIQASSINKLYRFCPPVVYIDNQTHSHRKNKKKNFEPWDLAKDGERFRLAALQGKYRKLHEEGSLEFVAACSHAYTTSLGDHGTCMYALPNGDNTQ